MADKFNVQKALTMLEKDCAYNIARGDIFLWTMIVGFERVLTGLSINTRRNKANKCRLNKLVRHEYNSTGVFSQIANL